MRRAVFLGRERRADWCDFSALHVIHNGANGCNVKQKSRSVQFRPSTYWVVGVNMRDDSAEILFQFFVCFFVVVGGVFVFGFLSCWETVVSSSGIAGMSTL